MARRVTSWACLGLVLLSTLAAASQETDETILFKSFQKDWAQRTPAPETPPEAPDTVPIAPAETPPEAPATAAAATRIAEEGEGPGAANWTAARARQLWQAGSKPHADRAQALAWFRRAAALAPGNAEWAAKVRSLEDELPPSSPFLWRRRNIAVAPADADAADADADAAADTNVRWPTTWRSTPAFGTSDPFAQAHFPPPTTDRPRCALSAMVDVTKATWAAAPPASVLRPVARAYPARCRIRKNYHINTTYYRRGTPEATKTWYEGLAKVQRAFVEGAPVLVPPGAREGSCVVGYADGWLGPFGPLPQRARVLFVGNSQLNQIAQSIACRFADRLVLRLRRRVGGACGTCHLELAELYPRSPDPRFDAAVRLLQANSGELVTFSGDTFAEGDPCVRKRWGAKARDAPSEKEEAALDERTPVYKFRNGAELSTIINSPVFYVRGNESIVPAYDVPRRVARLLLSRDDLSGLSHVVWHGFNGKPWGGHHFQQICPGMVRDRASDDRLRMQKYGVVRIPDIKTVVDQIAALGYVFVMRAMFFPLPSPFVRSLTNNSCNRGRSGSPARCSCRKARRAARPSAARRRGNTPSWRRAPAAALQACAWCAGTPCGGGSRTGTASGTARSTTSSTTSACRGRWMRWRTTCCG